MTGCDVLKRLAAFAACARAFAKTPQGAGAGETPVLLAGERRSIGRAANAVAVGVLLGTLAITSSVYGQQAKAPSGADTTGVKTSRVANDVDMKRRDILNGIQTEESSIHVAERRLFIAEGGEPERVRNDRNRGADFTPDANQIWLTVIRRDADEGRSLELYEKLVKDGKGTEKPEELLNTVASAAMSDRPKVQIGGEVVEATPSLSPDAGYTKGFRDRVTMNSLGIADTPDNVTRLHAIAESCLDGQNTKAPPASTCFTAGLALAAKDNPIASTRR